MTKGNKQFELIKGIFVTENSDIDYCQGKRLSLSKFKQFDRNLNGQTYPEQAVRDKIGKNNGWSVAASSFDPNTKCMSFEVVVNANTTVIHNIDYKSICNEFGWKSFTVTNNNQCLVPKCV